MLLTVHYLAWGPYGYLEITITITNNLFRHIWFNKTVCNNKFLKINMFKVMGITLGHQYRWHATTENIKFWLITRS